MKYVYLGEDFVLYRALGLFMIGFQDFRISITDTYNEKVELSELYLTEH